MISRVSAGLMLVFSMAVAKADLVDVSSGSLKGERIGNVTRYMGVPYAQPPVDNLRWRAPQPELPWNGIRNALQPGSACVQVGNFFASQDESTFDKPYGSEDCLYLNIWTPVAKNQDRPVLVFFHGGSGIAGDAAHPFYDGGRLAEELDVVVITANYRLGIFGSLQTPALHTGDPAEDSGSFYLLDMIRVLDWVGQNCPALDCDNNNITISGQSAGAVAVLALLRSPLAKGKFQRAISLSGIPFSASSEQAQQRTITFLTSLMMKDGSASTEEEAAKLIESITAQQLSMYLYSQSAETLLKASGYGLSPQALDDGAVLLKLDKPSKMAAKTVSSVPLLIGKTRDEMSTLVPIGSIGRNATKLWPLFNGEPRAETINQQLGWFKGVRRDLKIRFSNWYLNRKFTKILDQYAEQLPAVYVYEFKWDNYPEPWKSDMGAFHGLDLPFVFGNFINDRKIYMRFAWTPENRGEREALHQEIVASLRAFIWGGNPNMGDTDWPLWNEEQARMIWGR